MPEGPALVKPDGPAVPTIAIFLLAGIPVAAVVEHTVVAEPEKLTLQRY